MTRKHRYKLTVGYWATFFQLFKSGLETEGLHAGEGCSQFQIKDRSSFDGVCLCAVELNRMLGSVMYLPEILRR